MDVNRQQIEGQLRTALAAGGPIAALILSKSGMSATDYALYAELAIAILPGLIVAGWSWWTHRTANQVKTAGNIEGVTVTVDASNANVPAAAVAVAIDPKIDRVLLASSPPTPTTSGLE